MNKTRWENTLSAFAAAAERGYAIECDVHLSSDRVPVIFHDERSEAADRTGRFRLAAHGSRNAALNIGGTVDHLPTLQQMLDLVDGRVPVVDRAEGHSRP